MLSATFSFIQTAFLVVSPALFIGIIILICWKIVDVLEEVNHKIKYMDKNGVRIRSGMTVEFEDVIVNPSYNPQEEECISILNRSKIKVYDFNIELYDYDNLPSQMSEYYSHIISGEGWYNVLKNSFEVIPKNKSNLL